MSWLDSSIVKTLRGYWSEVGSCSSGSLPATIPGTAIHVPSATVVALRYHVDVAARRPKPG
jgi:hypothetical protein